MIESAKITAVHRQRLAVVYVRQSSPGQLERNRESTLRQYNFVARAVALGWAEAQVIVIDEDQGVSASGLFDRAGFAQLTAEVALAHVGIVLGLELSRLSRNNADWYRLLDLCGLTGTLLADEDGSYDPSAFNDRLLLGLKRPVAYSTPCSTSPSRSGCRDAVGLRLTLRVGAPTPRQPHRRGPSIDSHGQSYVVLGMTDCVRPWRVPRSQPWRRHK